MLNDSHNRLEDLLALLSPTAPANKEAVQKEPCISSQRSLVQVQYRLHSRKSHQFDFNEVLSLILSANPNFASQLRLRQLDNDTLFDTYINELKLQMMDGVLSEFKLVAVPVDHDRIQPLSVRS